MTFRVFMTAFEPYDSWETNSSWLTLVEYTRSMSSSHQITTRLYPVDFKEVRRRLEKDLTENYDFAIHLGQAPGAAQVRLEAVGLNVGGNSRAPRESYQTLVEDGPVAYRSAMPLAESVSLLRENGIPASISYYAGTFLCNATLYLTHYLAEKQQLRTRATFVHLPLETSQVAAQPQEVASLPATAGARAVALLVESLVKLPLTGEPELA